VQCVLLLLPDEHREALETLLDFLNHVASNSPYNQMTASNLAVCLAPSLFHFNHSNTNVTNRSSSVSPRRRKTVGIPDQRELSENKAAHDCLLYLVKMHRELFMVSAKASLFVDRDCSRAWFDHKREREKGTAHASSGSFRSRRTC